MQTYIKRGKLGVASLLLDFIEKEALPHSQVSADTFWQGFESILHDLMPKNKALLEKRANLQSQIDDFCSQNKPPDLEDYKTFLTDIGYLVAEPNDFEVGTEHVDAEIATMAGPQLVVPINNARYALNAVNARWGSLYDALYGTDVISQEGELAATGGYNKLRGQEVIKTARNWLDKTIPLLSGSHAQAIKYQVVDGELNITLDNNERTSIQDQSRFIGFNGEALQPQQILLKHNGLHLIIEFDPEHPIGKDDPASIKDISVEAALTTIMDCEDSVAAVDAEDKTLVYKNWLGIMQGNLQIQVNKAGKSSVRSMRGDLSFTDKNGQDILLSGRSLMFVRNVGHLMTSDAILFNGQEIPEGIMDGVITSLIGKHDLLGNGTHRNSREQSIYIVKPKMHGPEEVAFANTLFSRIESMLGLNENTIKMGIMDEERRTSANLKACIHAAKDRVVFINTGFLDRTGDEIHTSILQGPFATKAEIKNRPWLHAYERANVMHGVQSGMSGKGQIGKGMWPIPDQMANMMETKVGHPKAGANTAWVPSPTAATLHALHYHLVDVFETQKLLKNNFSDELNDILTIPLLADEKSLSEGEIQNELDNNVQGILGYVARWVHQGVGCSKVPDINNVGLMEDRATLRISSQHICNWLLHGIVNEEQIETSMQRMAKLVDEQNAGEAGYIAMTPDTKKSLGYQAAKELILKGKEQPSGYTEPVLHRMRREMKKA